MNNFNAKWSGRRYRVFIPKDLFLINIAIDPRQPPNHKIYHYQIFKNFKSWTSEGIYDHKTKKVWVCRGKVKKHICGFEFKTPSKISALTPEMMRQRAAYKLNLYNEMRTRFFDEHGESLRKKAVVYTFEQSREYLTLNNTATSCKKCAFLWDKKGMELCSVCNTGYKWIGLPSCFKCAKATKN